MAKLEVLENQEANVGWAVKGPMIRHVDIVVMLNKRKIVRLNVSAPDHNTLSACGVLGVAIVLVAFAGAVATGFRVATSHTFAVKLDA